MIPVAEAEFCSPAEMHGFPVVPTVSAEKEALRDQMKCMKSNMKGGVSKKELRKKAG